MRPPARAAMEARIGEAAAGWRAFGDATLAASAASLAADPRVTPVAGAPIPPAELEAVDDLGRVALALVRIDLTSAELAGVLSAPPLYVVSTADVGRYWTAPAFMPLVGRVALAVALRARNPALAPLADAVQADAMAALRRCAADAGTWLGEHVAAKRLERAAAHYVRILSNPASAPNVAAQTGTPADTRRAYLAAARAAARMTRR